MTVEKIEVGPNIANIEVQCPMPEHRALGSMTVAQLMEEQPELAEKVIVPLIETTEMLKKAGMSPREAANQAFKPVAVIDEQTGEVQRALAYEHRKALFQNTAEPESKKKVAPTNQF